MNAQKRSLLQGIVLTVSFFIVLVLLFMPLFNGHNTMEYLDNLYNSISKGSANYIATVKEEVTQFQSVDVEIAFSMSSEDQASQTAQLITAGGANVLVEGKQLNMKGDLGGILLNAIADAEKMYDNNGEAVRNKYGYDERRALYNWWSALKMMDFELNKQKQFKEAKLVAMAQNKTVEMAYNYYGIEAQKVRDQYLIIIASLLFYVIYTLWFGFGVLYLFEGVGLNMGH